jgi:hypothetical protein
MSVDKAEPSKMPSSASTDLEKQGCGTSFLNGKRNETDKLCGGTQAATPKEEYVQPDEEKEAGGEA